MEHGLHSHVGVSDLHLGSPDLKRRVQGVTGMELLEAFSQWTYEHYVSLFVFGDGYDYCGQLPEALRECRGILEKIPHKRLVHGNHDKRNRGAWEIEYIQSDDDVIENAVAMIDYTWRGMHWHQLDPAWNKDTPFWDAAGEAVIKRGRQMQLHIHPKIDEWLLRGGKKVGRLFMPSGGRYTDGWWLRRIAEISIGVDVELGGHIHRLWWTEWNGVTYVNMGAWTPVARKGGGEEIAAGVWHFENRKLYRWTMSGLVEVPKTPCSELLGSRD